MFSLKSILFLLFLILIVHIVATANYWYWTFRWFDIPMHFLGGFWVAMVYFWLKARITRGSNTDVADQHTDPRALRDSSNKISAISATIIGCLAFVALIGVLWEFFEFLLALFVLKTGYLTFLKIPQGAAMNTYDIYKDTLKDLFFDLVGGLGTASIFQLRKNKDHPLE